MKRLSILFLMFILAVATAACGGQSAAPEQATSAAAAPAPEETEMTITHNLGETKVKKNPEKVVVFDFGVLDSLDKLGVEITALPQSNVPKYLSKYTDSKYVNVGTLKEPDFEKISEINPDLIIISGRQQELYDEFSKLGPTIFMGVDSAKYMESYTENAKRLGSLFGKEAQVDEELAKVNASLEALNAKASASGKNALIILANEGNISAYGAGSRFGIIHDVMGFKPVDESIQVTTHGQSISFEYIAEKNPDYLFVIDRNVAVGTSDAGAKQLVENQLVQKTKAYADGNIVYLDPDYWYLSGGGLISVAEMVKQMEEAAK
ncbi:siderophore ABC transporter substrate-binding protein [Ammoniphilus sp. YIM 78166]|uniref:siderophore ABC transporter substrate-binding protein n=1 Tax=Ammoniphilus sp. YIM 78166 TaxID=1644106 RepID=UPI00106F9A86|nr:siderophore ABC transporter substrate-binding protein [Ammoniphilus sp. YIM 78166]